jgi:hypothetical protein
MDSVCSSVYDQKERQREDRDRGRQREKTEREDREAEMKRERERGRERGSTVNYPAKLILHTHQVWEEAEGIAGCG